MTFAPETQPKFKLIIYFLAGSYELTNLSIGALLQEIRRADECLNIIKIVAFKEKEQNHED